MTFSIRFARPPQRQTLLSDFSLVPCVEQAQITLQTELVCDLQRIGINPSELISLSVNYLPLSYLSLSYGAPNKMLSCWSLRTRKRSKLVVVTLIVSYCIHDSCAA